MYLFRNKWALVSPLTYLERIPPPTYLERDGHSLPPSTYLVAKYPLIGNRRRRWQPAFPIYLSRRKLPLIR